MKNGFLKISKYLLIFLIGVVALVFIGIFVLFFASPGKAELFINEDNIVENSISTIEKIKLGGVEQYLIIRGFDLTKPVLLLLHGGPGTPELGYVKKYNPKLEKEFVVIYWEQRAAGKSFNKTISSETMNTEQFVQDTRELSEYLIVRFNKKKIYLMGHSWGSFLGINTIKKYPNLYHCYFGIGQVANQFRSEKISFDWVKNYANKIEDKSGINKLNAITLPRKDDNSKNWLEFLRVERGLIDKYGGGLLRKYKGKHNTFLPILLAKEYTLKDKLNYSKGAFFSIEHLWEEIMASNLFVTIDSIEVPVYLFHGRHDYQTTHLVAKEFYDHLKAPKKGFYTFENSAHSPFFDEPKRLNQILREIINE